MVLMIMLKGIMVINARNGSDPQLLRNLNLALVHHPDLKIQGSILVRLWLDDLESMQFGDKPVSENVLEFNGPANGKINFFINNPSSGIRKQTAVREKQTF